MAMATSRHPGLTTRGLYVWFAERSRLARTLLRLRRETSNATAVGSPTERRATVVGSGTAATVIGVLGWFSKANAFTVA